jgi:hypothetical protein
MSRTRRPRMTAQERREQRAFDLLCSPEADDFARALDLHGWMIVVKPQYVFDDGSSARWLMNEPSDNCPGWADNDVPPPEKPKLRVIDGGRKPETE